MPNPSRLEDAFGDQSAITQIQDLRLVRPSAPDPTSTCFTHSELQSSIAQQGSRVVTPKQAPLLMYCPR
jgi:hypothetical protein